MQAEITAPLEFVRDEYGFWSWALYDGEHYIASCKGFETRRAAVAGFKRLAGIPVESLLAEAVTTNERGDVLDGVES